MLKYLAVIILSVSTFFSSPYRYFQSQKLQKTANTLAIQNKYSDALKKYEEAQKVWDNEDINIKIQDTKEALENYSYYQDGSKFIDKKMWDEAIISLSKVQKPSKYFDTAQSLLDYAKGKIEEKKEKEIPEVKGLNTNSNTFIKEVDIPLPTIIIEPTAVVMPTQPPIQSNEAERRQYYLKCTKDIDDIRSEKMNKCYQDYAYKNSEFPPGQNYYYNQCAAIVTSLSEKAREDCANLYGN